MAELLVVILATATLTLAVTALTIQVRHRIMVVTVTGDSMRPTYRPGDRILVGRYDPSELKTGQVVVIERPSAHGGWPAARPRWPGTSGDLMIKRVAALPGDTLTTGTVVPPGKLVVLGDNPAASLDSRQFGYCPVDQLLGIVIRRAR